MIKLIVEKIIGWLKTIFKGESMSFEFPTFKVAEIEAAINIKDQATTDGKMIYQEQVLELSLTVKMKQLQKLMHFEIRKLKEQQNI